MISKGDLRKLNLHKYTFIDLYKLESIKYLGKLIEK